MHRQFVANGGQLWRDTEVLDASRTSTGFMLEVTVGGHRSTVADALNRFR